MSAATERCANCFKDTMGGGTCPHCGWVPGQPTLPPYIPVGTLLNNCYLIGKVLGHGGFGITYLGWDTNLELLIAIKEYFPKSLATRIGDNLNLSIYPGQKKKWFHEGLKRFQEEARILARLQNYPGIVRVHSFFSANDTCYMVMEYIVGITLKQYIIHRQKLSYRSTYTILKPVMEALDAIHRVRLLHRDISPQNIYITQQQHVKLLDFGSARFLTKENRDPLIIIKSGFAPNEQYNVQGEQGPWTDVYGLAATFYNCITGTVPLDASVRFQKDELKRPSELGIKLPVGVETVLLKGLALQVEERFQDILSFQQALPKPASRHTTQQTKLNPQNSPQEIVADTLKFFFAQDPLILAIIIGIIVLLVFLLWLYS